MPLTPSSADDGDSRLALPHVFVDRSLGAIQLPGILRNHGIALTTMREHYGEFAGQRIADTDWIALVAERGWIGFHKDAKIRRNEIERRAVLASRSRMFCIPRADITADEAAKRFLHNLDAIRIAAADAGPFIYSVKTHGIERLL